MFEAHYGRYKYLALFSALNITFLLISNFTASRLIDVHGMGTSVTVLYFPFTYLIADILTEVYGYAQARSAIWLALFCSLIAALVVSLAMLVPAVGFFKDDAAYQTVFASGLRNAFCTLAAVFTGDICNSYILAKLKIYNKGKHLWLRFVVSTIIGEGVNTLVFYALAFYGVLPMDLLVKSILLGWGIKTAVEVLMLPLTYPLVRFLKRTEGVDFFDTDTNFNPFIMHS